MAYYRGNVWTHVCHRPEKARFHWVLQLCGSIIGLIGIVIKIFLEEVHFHTRHGIIGERFGLIIIYKYNSVFCSFG